MPPKKRKERATPRRGEAQSNDVNTEQMTDDTGHELMDYNDKHDTIHNIGIRETKHKKRGRQTQLAGEDIMDNATNVLETEDNSGPSGADISHPTDTNDKATDEINHGDPDVNTNDVKRGPQVIDITCAENKGILFMKGLSTGSKGACVLFEQNWLTPNEFQYISGRESAKDWKRSLKHYGKSLKVLVSRGLMCLKQRRCKCCVCEGRDNDESVANSPSSLIDVKVSDSGSPESDSHVIEEVIQDKVHTETEPDMSGVQELDHTTCIHADMVDNSLPDIEPCTSNGRSILCDSVLTGMASNTECKNTNILKANTASMAFVSEWNKAEIDGDTLQHVTNKAMANCSVVVCSGSIDQNIDGENNKWDEASANTDDETGIFDYNEQDDDSKLMDDGDLLNKPTQKRNKSRLRWSGKKRRKSRRKKHESTKEEPFYISSDTKRQKLDEDTDDKKDEIYNDDQSIMSEEVDTQDTLDSNEDDTKLETSQSGNTVPDSSLGVPHDMISDEFQNSSDSTSLLPRSNGTIELCKDIGLDIKTDESISTKSTDMEAKSNIVDTISDNIIENISQSATGNNFSLDDDFKKDEMKHDKVEEYKSGEYIDADVNASLDNSLVSSREPVPGPSGSNGKSAKKRGSKLLSIIDHLKSTSHEEKIYDDKPTNTDRSHKSRKDNAPIQYCSTSRQYQPILSSVNKEEGPVDCVVSEPSDTVIRTPKPYLPTYAQTKADPCVNSKRESDSYGAVKPERVQCVKDIRKSETDPSNRFGYKDVDTKNTPQQMNDAFLLSHMAAFPMSQYGTNIPPMVYSSMLQNGLPLEWQLALMNRQLGPSELALLTSAMHHQASYMHKLHTPIEPPNKSHQLLETGHSSRSSSSSSHSGRHSRTSDAPSHFMNGRVHHSQSLHVTKHGSSGGNMSSSSGSSSRPRLTERLPSSHHRPDTYSYRDALSQRAMATMRVPHMGIPKESTLPWNEPRRPTSTVTSHPLLPTSSQSSSRDNTNLQPRQITHSAPLDLTLKK